MTSTRLETKLTGKDQAVTESGKVWVFLPVAKNRIIKRLDKAILIKINYDHSTILPVTFKRNKEDEKYIYFSLPSDFECNLRTTIKRDNGTYDHVDELVPLLINDENGNPKVSYSMWVLRLPYKEDELPF